MREHPPLSSEPARSGPAAPSSCRPRRYFGVVRDCDRLRALERATSSSPTEPGGTLRRPDAPCPIMGCGRVGSELSLALLEGGQRRDRHRQEPWRRSGATPGEAPADAGTPVSTATLEEAGDQSTPTPSSPFRQEITRTTSPRPGGASTPQRSQGDRPDLRSGGAPRSTGGSTSRYRRDHHPGHRADPAPAPPHDREEIRA